VLGNKFVGRIVGGGGGERVFLPDLFALSSIEHARGEFERWEVVVEEEVAGG